MSRSPILSVLVVVALLLASSEGAIKKCRQDQKTLVSSLSQTQEQYHTAFLQECLAKFEETHEFNENTFECKATDYAVSLSQSYREACASSGGLGNVLTNSHINLQKKKMEILLSVSWFQCISSSCSIETDLPYIAASQQRDNDFGAATLQGFDKFVPTYVDGLSFFFTKKNQQPVEPAYGSSSSSSDPYGYYSASSESNPYAGSSSSSSSSYGYSSSSSSSSDPYGYSSSSSSSDPYGYYSSSSSSSDPYGYSSSSSSSDPYGYHSASSESNPYAGSSSSSSSDPYGYYSSSSSSSSDPYGYYSSSSSSSSDPYGYSSSSSSSSPYPGEEEESENNKHIKGDKKHHDNDNDNNNHHHSDRKGHDANDNNSNPVDPASSALALLFSSIGILFVFLLLVVFAVIGLAFFRRRSESDSFALVNDHQYASKEV